MDYLYGVLQVYNRILSWLIAHDRQYWPPPEKKIMRYISWLQTTDLSIQKFSLGTSTSQLSMYSVWKNYMKSSSNTSIPPVLKIVLVFDMLHMKTSISFVYTVVLKITRGLLHKVKVIITFTTVYSTVTQGLTLVTHYVMYVKGAISI